MRSRYSSVRYAWRTRRRRRGCRLCGTLSSARVSFPKWLETKRAPDTSSGSAASASSKDSADVPTPFTREDAGYAKRRLPLDPSRPHPLTRKPRCHDWRGQEHARNAYVCQAEACSLDEARGAHTRVSPAPLQLRAAPPTLAIRMTPTADAKKGTTSNSIPQTSPGTPLE